VSDKETPKKKKVPTEAKVLLGIIFGYAIIIVFYMIIMMANSDSLKGH
jgi:hypothetical protein